MTTAIMARVPKELAEAAKRRARETDQSLSAYLTSLLRRDVEAAQEAKLWDAYETFHADPDNAAQARRDAEEWAGTLMDGLDPDELAEGTAK